LVFTGFR